MPRHLLILLAIVVLASLARGADEPFAAKTLRDRLAAHPKGDAAKALADDVRKWTRPGPNPKVDGLDVSWVLAVDDPSAHPKVVSQDGTFSLPLERIEGTDLHVGSTTLPEGAGFLWRIESAGRPISLGVEKKGQPRRWAQLEVYKPDPDAAEKSGVPKGTLKAMPVWSSKVFDGTSRDWWVYVPAEGKVSKDKPACVMVFQDGAGYREFVPAVFDNLIHEGAMPPTVGIFINPGTFEGGRSNRSFEYDTLSDRYARFLLEEILPEVEKTTPLRKDPDSRAIAGISSGGICAWTVAWERPAEFRKVLSWVGSFTNIASGKTVREGGHNYEALVRKTEKKPIRVFLQDGANDLDNANGNWPLANQTLAKSLAFKGYDYKFVYGNGFHSNRHGRSILGESLRWLWRDVKP